MGGPGLSAPVHILATCRKPELIGGTLLVFDTLRVGFPTAKVTVHLNRPKCEETISERALQAGCSLVRHVSTIHHLWIESLLKICTEPFWILDTDVVFWSSVESLDMSECYLAGTYTSPFNDPFTKCETQSRLHTCLMYFDPVKIQSKVAERLSQHPATAFNPCINLIHPVMLPAQGKTYFMDTCGFLYAAIKGTPFTAEQLKCFEHLHCGTWSDLLAPVFPAMQEIHENIYSDPKQAHGLREVQDEFYRKHAA